jgi:hypothetical protein
VTVNWTQELVDQLDWHWTAHLRPRLDGLTDDEYLWEPVAGSWSIRPRSATVTPAVGRGPYVLEIERPEPIPPPVTTIAWRMAHISVGVLGQRASNHFGAFGGALTEETAQWSAKAAGGLTMLDDSYTAWMAGVRGLDDAGLAQPCGPAEGPFSEYPLAALILHINREVLHHGAEIALLRDLYRFQRRS